MDAHALKVLEFDKVTEALADHTASSLGYDLAITVSPSNTLAEAERKQAETAEARQLLDDYGGMPLGGVRNILGHIEKALLAGALTGRELLEVRDTIVASDRLRAFLKKHTEATPTLSRIADNLLPLPEIVEVVNASIDDAGEVRDSASPELARLRREIRTTNGRIQDKLNSILQSTGSRDSLQDPVIVSRHGRWCVPVRSSHKGTVPGIVHDVSASGATLFVEPQAVVDMGNKLRELETAEQEEVERILRQLTSKIAARAEELRVVCSALAELDLTNARALYAESLDCTRPRLSQAARLSFKRARHPLLKGEVVPIDIRVGSDFTGLLITGPNTGGKTVTLKTVGLLVLMAQAGMQIPAAEGSESGIFTDVFADIGDEQSIEQSLSTFSGHIRNIVHTLQNVQPGSLVLFDELGAGTDPAEGAALASEVLKYLAGRDARIIATTHYGELKSFAFLVDGLENASVEFDRETLKPTYRLLIGIPGASHALHIAERLGMPPQVIRGAREALEGRTSSADELMSRVEQTRLNALADEEKAAAARREAEGLRGRYEQDLSRLADKQEQFREQLQEEARRSIRQTQAELDEVLRHLRTQKRHSQNTEGLARKAKRLIDKIKQTAETPALPEASLPEGEAATTPSMKKGDKVRMIGVGAIGTLLEDPSAEEALVAFGSIEARVSVDRLETVVAPPRQRHASGSPAAEMARASTISPEIMLRGQRVEDAIANLDRYLDDAALAGLERVRVIHGKGTGTLRKAVWEHMRAHPSVDSIQLADASEGGEGATIAKLK